MPSHSAEPAASSAKLHFAAFTQVTPGHLIQGSWRRPGVGDHNDLDVWVDLARTLERGKFDALFFADVHGVYDPFLGSRDKYVEIGLGIPNNDPSALISALAYATRDIGFAFTSSIIQEHPFDFARKISTLDHASRGRVAWNIVTSQMVNSATNFGLADRPAHDDRYAWADEYVDVLYKLWEGSWDDDAVVRDARSGLYADPRKVHRINHVGPRYSVEGPHLSSPSPQRTPVLFQAGASTKGRGFAGRNAEAVFLTAPTPEVAAKDAADIRATAVAHGRLAEDVKIFQGLQFVVGSTEEEARRKSDEIDSWIDWQGQLAHMGGVAGVDFGTDDLDTSLGDIDTETLGGTQSLIRWTQESVTGREATLRDLAQLLSRSNRLVGTPEQIADRLAQWRDAGIDGILVMNTAVPATYVDFVDHVIPVLQRRGLAQSEYAPGSLRNRLFGAGDRLPDRHPAARYRHAFSGISV